MKGLLTAGLAWLSADPLVRFSPRHAAPRARSEDNPDATVAPDAATPAGAQAQPAVRKFFVNGTSTVVAGPPTGVASALYIMSNNNAASNTIFAYAVGSNGLISSAAPKKWSANGNGRQFSYTGDTVQDALDSQGSLIQAGARLFAVNAGSNTVQQFAINCTDPTNLVALGGPVKVNGNYPSTIAVAEENNIFCVATTGQNSGIQCFDYSVGFGSGSIRSPQAFTGTNVSLPLPVAQTQNVPLGPADTVSQLLFTDDEKYLFAVVKSQVNSAGKVTNMGYINVYPISQNGLGKPVQSKPSGTALLFGCTFQFNTYNLFCADSGVGSVFLRSNSDLTLTLSNSVQTASFGNGTNCWVQRSRFIGGPNYLSAVDKNYIASFNSSNGNLIASSNFGTSGNIGFPNPQLIELQTAASFVYGLSFGNATAAQHLFVAQDSSNNGHLKAVQELTLSGLTDTVDGLALFIPTDRANTCDFQ